MQRSNFISAILISIFASGYARELAILITDPGIDDAAAVLYALSSPELEVLGICSNFGVVDSATAASNALLLVKKSGAQVPVYLGADHPLGELPLSVRGAPGGRNFHGLHGLGSELPKYPDDLNVNSTISAVEFILSTCRSQPNKVNIVIFSPPTTLAQAVSADPKLVYYVKRVYAMGGALDSPGNTSPLAEANFANDAAASALIIARFSGKLTIAPLDTTLKVLYSENDLKMLSDNGGDTAKWLLQTLGPFYLSKYREISGVQPPLESCAISKNDCDILWQGYESQGFMPLHDVHAVMALTHPEIYVSKNMAIEVLFQYLDWRT